MRSRALCIVALVASLPYRLGAQPPKEEPVATAEAAHASPLPTSELAPEDLRQTLTKLRSLAAGEADENLPIAELLGGSVPTPTTIADRVDGARVGVEQARISLTNAERARRISLESPAEGGGGEAQTAQESQHAIDDARLHLDVVSLRLQHLEVLAATYESMPGPARRAFELLGQPRAPVRQQAAAIERLVDAAARLVDRARALEEMISAGRLVGFVAEQRAVHRRIQLLAERLLSDVETMNSVRAGLNDLATRQQAEGRALTERVLTIILSGAGAGRIDPLYLDHLREQRRLRRTLLVEGTAVSVGRLADLAAAADRVLANPATISDLFAAEAAVGQLQQVIDDLDALCTSLISAPERWSLAFEREIVTLLEPLASEATRRKARQFSTEILEELRIEALDAWSRAVQWMQTYPAEVRARMSQWRQLSGRALIVVLLMTLALLLGTKKLAPMRWLVRWTARSRLARGWVGPVVRWGNALQTVFPSVAVYGLVFAGLFVIGFHRPEALVIWTVVRWLGLYWIGRQTLLGLTRPVSRGRPALIRAAPDTVELLRLTYGRLGLIFALSFAAEEIAAGWFGVGHLIVVIDMLLVAWVGGWALWAGTAWRQRLAEGWLALGVGPRQAALAQWMRESRFGALLSFVALVRLAVAVTLNSARWLLERFGVTTYLRARSLLRLSREAPPPKPSGDIALPEAYLGEFPLYPLLDETSALALPREDITDAVKRHYARWNGTRTDASLLLVGEKGIGKTTLLARLPGILGADNVFFHTWGKKATSERAVASELGALFGSQAVTVAELIEAARQGPERVVILDEVHNVFLRTIDGYRGFDALVELVNGTSERVFWVLAFNTFSWQFLNESRGRTHYFRKLLWVEPWSAADIKSLIDRRNRRSGFEVEFDADLLDADASAGDFQLVESAEGFFRLLWESSAGNPRVALYFWLESLHYGGGERIHARLFRRPNIGDVQGLTDEMVFVLASICQHENLSVDDLRAVLRMKPERARFAMQFLCEAKLVESKAGQGDAFTLAPRYYPQVLSFLRKRHLLFESSR